MGRSNYKALAALVCSLLAGCVKDKPATMTSGGGAGNVYVVCEGNFGSGNSSVYSLDANGGAASGDLYKAANGTSAGDVLQSMTRIGARYFLCVNNSDKVIAVDTGSLKVAGTIPVPKPRYVLPVSATKAYVSALYGNKVYVIDPQAMAVTDTISLPDMNPEGMCRYYDKVFVCTWDTTGNRIYKVDAATNSVEQAVTIGGYAPQEAVVDREQMLWVLSGNKSKKIGAKLTRVDPSSGNVVRTYDFPAGADALKPVMNNTGDTLYFIEADYFGGTANNGIYRMGIHEADVPATPFVAANQYQYFWALGVEPGTGNIFAGDPKGFVQRGSVYVYRQDGTLVNTFDVGMGPGHFYFEQ